MQGRGQTLRILLLEKPHGFHCQDACTSLIPLEQLVSTHVYGHKILGNYLGSFWGHFSLVNRLTVDNTQRWITPPPSRQYFRSRFFLRRYHVKLVYTAAASWESSRRMDEAFLSTHDPRRSSGESVAFARVFTRSFLIAT